MLFARRLTEFLLGCIVALAPWTLFLTLPQSGLSELSGVSAVSVAGHFLASVAAILGLLHIACAPSKTWRNPVTAALVVSLISLPAAINGLISPDPGLTWFGGAVDGLGTLWFIELGVLSFAAALIWQSGPSWRGTLLASMATAALTATFLPHLNGPATPTSDWSFLPMMTAATLLIASRHWPTRILGVAIAIASLLSGAFVPTLVLSIAGGGGVLLARLLAGRNDMRIGIFGVLAVLGAISTLGLLGPFLEDAVMNKHALPLAQIDMGAEIFGATWGRSIALQSLFRGLDENPIYFFSGYGYGRLHELLTLHGTWLDVRLFSEPAQSAAATYWNPSDTDLNTLATNLLAAGGLSAALVWAAGIWLAVNGSRQLSARHSFGVVALLTFGLCLAPASNAALGFIAIAVGSIVPLSGDISGRRKVIAETALPIVIGVFSLVTAAATSIAMLSLYNLKFDDVLSAKAAEDTCAITQSIGLPNAATNSALFQAFMTQTTSGSYDVGAIIADPTWQQKIGLFLCRSEHFALAGNKDSLLISLQQRSILGQLFEKHDVRPSLVIAKYLRKWGDDLLIVAPLMRRPGPMIIRYLEWATTQYGNSPELESHEEFLLGLLSAEDPARYWVMARKAIFDDDTDGYSRNLKEAIARGLPNLIPLSDRLAQFDSDQSN